MIVHCLDVDASRLRSALSLRNPAIISLCAAAMVGAVVLMLGATPVRAQMVYHFDFVFDASDPAVCLDCHDGSVASAVNYCTSDCVIDLASSHPINRPYPPPGREQEYVTRNGVEAYGIRLRDGMVTCVSCHDLQNREEFYLVKARPVSRLCLSCHLY